MQYPEKSVQLKNGAVCTLRSALPADAAEVLRCFLQTHEETDFLLTYPSENTMDAEGERGFLTAQAGDPYALELCAIVDGHLCGTAGFSAVSSREKLRHRAEFGIAVERAYWGCGIGRVLTEACIACAGQAGYLQLELDVVAENTAAIALYRSLGFREYGRNPRGFRTRGGAFQELVLMQLPLADSFGGAGAPPSSMALR